MSNKLKRQERQMMLWESDDRIVQLTPADQADGSKLGNSSAGKAVKLTRDPDRAAAVHRDGQPLITRLDRITQVAERDERATFNNLYTMLDYELLYNAFCRLKRDKAPGVDGISVNQYGERLNENLRSLETRLHRQSYRPQPSLRRDIPKGHGKTRPLGIACAEDKIVQRAIVMIMERIYEVDFMSTSYGFRPNRSCHQALSVLGQTIATKRVNWISDADIKGFFDNVSHTQLLELLKQRITDPRLLWLIERFLKAGVMIEGQRVDTDGGVAQGSVLSPLLANVYLHYVLDQWFQRDIKPRLKGESHIVRYADDFICAFENETDARRFQEVLHKRLARFSLELAQEKTKLIRFGRFAARATQRAGVDAPQTFDFLRFTHYCGRSREGKFKLKRMTSFSRPRQDNRPYRDDSPDKGNGNDVTLLECSCKTLHSDVFNDIVVTSVSWEPDALTALVRF